MALPSKTPRIAPKDYELATVQRQVVDTLDSVLALLNAMFTGSTTRPTAALGSLTLTGAITGQSVTVSNAGPALVSFINSTLNKTFNIQAGTGGNLTFRDVTLGRNVMSILTSSSMLSVNYGLTVAGGLTVDSAGITNAGTVQVQSASTLRSGSGVPSNAVGSDGDLYLNTAGTSTTMLYIKVAGAWVAK